MPDFIVYFWSGFGITAEEPTCAGMWESLECFTALINEERGDIVNIMGMAGIALLTVMIPLVVAVFGKDEAKKDYKILDWNVMLLRIEKMPFVVLSRIEKMPPVVLSRIEKMSLQWALFLVYVPLIVWALFPVPLFGQIFFCLVWAGGMVILYITIGGAYQWIKTVDRFELRITYLKELNASKNPGEMVESWRSVWKVKEIAPDKEWKFFNLFFKKIDDLLEKNYTLLWELINDFNQSIANRATGILINKEIFPKTLRWHFLFWKKEEQLRGGDINKWSLVNELYRQFSYTVGEIEGRILKEKSFFLLFPHLMRHAEKHKADTTKDGKVSYVEFLMSDFFHLLVKSLERDGRGFGMNDVWGFFPREWRITTKSVKEKENYIPRIWANVFFEWVFNRARGASKPDVVLSDVISNLFPTASPVMWAMLLDFLTRSSVVGKRIKTLIEGTTYFGLERVRIRAVAQGEDEERKAEKFREQQIKNEEKEAIGLALFWFGYEFTEKKLDEYIRELESMAENYSGEDKRVANYRRKEYLRIFEAMRDEVKRRAENAAE